MSGTAEIRVQDAADETMTGKPATGAGKPPTRAGMPEWAESRLRLDPWSLPHRIARESAGTSWTVDRHGAVMRATLPCGLPVSVALPSRSFRGVAARAMEQADGSMKVTLELHHHDPALCVPLLVADDLDDIAADWHAWSRMMRLPMLIVGADTIARPVREKLGEIMVEAPLARRKRFGTLKHRPWFLRRRKPGVVGPVTRISGEELFATLR